MNKTIKIDDFTKRQLDLAKKRRLNGDYVGAVNLLNTIAKNNDTWECQWELAQNYMSMGVYRNAIERWIRFLDVCPKDLRAEAYNGLGAAYYRTGDLAPASYYYDLLQDEPFYDIPDYFDERLGFYELAVQDEENEKDERRDYKLVEDAEKEDLERLIIYFEANCLSDKVDEHLPTLQKIPKTHELYLDAQMALATYYVLRSQSEVAFEIIRELEENYPDNPKPYIEELLLYSEGHPSKDKLRKKAIIEKLKSLDITDEKHCLEIANACIGVEEDEVTIEYCEKILQKNPYNCGGIFMMGTALYNLFEFESAEEYFTLCYQITGSVVAKFNVKRCRNPLKRPFERMHGLMMLPEDENDKFVNKALAYSRRIPEITDKNREDFYDVLNFIFSSPNEYQEKLAIALVRSKKEELIKYSKQLLLKLGVIDLVKVRILAELIFIGERGTVGMTFDDFYNSYKIKSFPEIGGEEDGKVVKSAHAIAIANAMIFLKSKQKNITQTALWVYDRLKENGNIDKVKDEVALAVAIIVLTVNGAEADSYDKNVAVLSMCLATTPRKVMAVIKKIRTDL